MSKSTATAGLRSSNKKTIYWVQNPERCLMQLIQRLGSMRTRFLVPKLPTAYLRFRRPASLLLLHCLLVGAVTVSRRRVQIAIWISLRVIGMLIRKAQLPWPAAFQTRLRHHHFLVDHKVQRHRFSRPILTVLLVLICHHSFHAL